MNSQGFSGKVSHRKAPPTHDNQPETETAAQGDDLDGGKTDWDSRGSCQTGEKKHDQRGI